MSAEIVVRDGQKILCVADMRNKAIRALDLDSGQVTTVAGVPGGPLTPVGPGSRIPLNQATLYYSWLRRDSRGNLFAIEGGNNYSIGESRILRVDLGQGMVEHVVRTVRGFRFDVDRRGNVGPVDHIIASGSNETDHGVFRLNPSDGSFTIMVPDSGYPEYMSKGTSGGILSGVHGRGR